MDILSLIGWRTDAADRGEGVRPPRLEVGDRLQGRVTRLLHQNLALVELAGGRFKAVAELKTPLNPGQRLRLEVTATTPRLTFQTMTEEKDPASCPPRSGAPPQGIMRLLTPSQAGRLIEELRTLASALKGISLPGSPKAGDVSTALVRLADHLSPLDPRGDPERMAAQLQARVGDGGLFFEAKLAAAVGEGAGGSPGTVDAPEKTPASQRIAQLLHSDLKPQLQRLLIQLPALLETLAPEKTLSAEGSGHLWTAVAALLEEIEEGQTRLRGQNPEDPPVVMRHSMWVAGRDKPLRFNVYLPRKKRGGGDPTASPMVSLRLDLVRFGPLRVDVREGPVDAQQRLKVDFWTQTEAARADLQAVTAPLVSLLEALYPQVDLRVALAPDKIAAFSEAAAPDPGDPQRRRRLDIRI